MHTKQQENKYHHMGPGLLLSGMALAGFNPQQQTYTHTHNCNNCIFVELMYFVCVCD
jgi:hypothetical protein